MKPVDIFKMVGLIVLTSLITWGCSFLIVDEWDWHLLLFINPGNRIPVMDEIVIFTTDFSIAIVQIHFLADETVRGGDSYISCFY